MSRTLAVRHRLQGRRRFHDGDSRPESTNEDGEARSVDRLCVEHGTALTKLVRAVLGTPGSAEVVVVGVFARACVGPGATAARAVRTGSLRRELARLAYLHATGCLPERHLAAPESAMSHIAELADLARVQRSALALIRYGDHTVDDLADLIGWPLPAIAALITAGLDESGQVVSPWSSGRPGSCCPRGAGL